MPLAASTTSHPGSSVTRRRTARSGPRAESRALYYRVGLGGRGGNWVDGIARCGTEAIHRDENPHLAKVRVAGSNPVFRSNKPTPAMDSGDQCLLIPPQRTPATRCLDTSATRLEGLRYSRAVRSGIASKSAVLRPPTPVPEQ
jgi:hypothetical protein